MLCAGGHCSHNCPSVTMKSKVDKTEVGTQSRWGTQEEGGKIREETNQTEPFQSTGCSKRNCELLGVSPGATQVFSISYYTG